MPTHAETWIEDHIPLHSHEVDARAQIRRLEEGFRLKVALTLTGGITNVRNMVPARGVAGIRILEEMAQSVLALRDEVRVLQGERDEWRKRYSNTLEAKIKLLEDENAMRRSVGA